MNTNWEELLYLFDSSNLTLSAFWANHSVAPSSFKYHHYKRKKKQHSGFVKLKDPLVSGLMLEVVYPNGVKVIVRGTVDAKLMSSLIYV